MTTEHTCPNCFAKNEISTDNGRVWVDADYCECCGISTTIHIDYICPICNYTGIDEIL